MKYVYYTIHTPVCVRAFVHVCNHWSAVFQIHRLCRIVPNFHHINLSLYKIIYGPFRIFHWEKRISIKITTIFSFVITIQFISLTRSFSVAWFCYIDMYIYFGSHLAKSITIMNVLSIECSILLAFQVNICSYICVSFLKHVHVCVFVCVSVRVWRLFHIIDKHTEP